ncbi:MAG: hypothetical protein JW751_01595 [Polyangiaceae bacterium]|nr:hypothetical protein [Polyangiaceae bacterium]
MHRRYPLEALEQLRAAEAAARVRELGEQVAERRRAEAAERAAHRAREQSIAMQRTVEVAEQGRLEAGVATVADLQSGASFIEAAAARAAELGRDEQAARRRARTAAGAEQRAREKLAEACAAEVVVERHHTDWAAARDRTAERVAEEEALEGWAVRCIARNHEGTK